MFGFLKKLFGPGVDLKEKMAQGAIILDVRSTDDKFIMAIENNHIDVEAVTTLLKSNGAIEVNHKEVK